MILRRSILRHGRRIPGAAARTPFRTLATETDLEPTERSINAIDQELKGAVQETKSIESRTASLTGRMVPQIDVRTQTTQTFLEDGTKELLPIHRYQQQIQKPLGSELEPHYDPHLLINNPPRPRDISLELLLASQTHLGHKTSHWNPGNSQYIFGIRQGIHIISLDVTAAHLRRACRVVSGVAERGGLILFVGTRPGQDRCVVEAAQRAKGYHLFERWTPGSITNGHQLLGRCKMKVINELDEDVPVPQEELEDRSTLKPDLVVVLNPLENWVLLHECGLTSVPTIGVIDTNADPTWVTYPIPANDDSLRATNLIAGVLGRAGEEGQKVRKQLAQMGKVSYQPENFGRIVVPEGREGIQTGGDPNAMHGGGSRPEVRSDV